MYQHQYHILIVEDEKRLAFFMRKVLEKEGFQITCFHNEKSALEYWLENKVDLVILDFYLSKTSETKIVDIIKKKSVLQPIIIISGCMTESIQKVLEFPYTVFIPKPFTKKDLLSIVKSYMEE